MSVPWDMRAIGTVCLVFFGDLLAVGLVLHGDVFTVGTACLVFSRDLLTVGTIGLVFAWGCVHGGHSSSSFVAGDKCPIGTVGLVFSWGCVLRWGQFI